MRLSGKQIPKYLNVLKSHSESAQYRGIYYNCTENSVYAASEAYYYFRVFNSSLTLIYTISVSPNRPRLFSE